MTVAFSISQVSLEKSESPCVEFLVCISGIKTFSLSLFLLIWRETIPLAIFSQRAEQRNLLVLPLNLSRRNFF